MHCLYPIPFILLWLSYFAIFLKNDIPLFEKVQQTYFLVWDTPDHTNIHMFINLNSINEDNLYGLCILEISYQPIEYGFLYLYSSSQLMSTVLNFIANSFLINYALAISTSTCV